jgi:hypothetical protein
MGLTVQDSISCSNGLQLSGCYISFRGKNVSVTSTTAPTANTAPYTISFEYSIWINREASSNNCQPVENKYDTFYCENTDLNTPIYQMCYDYLKSKYNNTEDC